MDTNYTISTAEFENIEQYLLDMMEPAQRIAFEERMQKESNLANKVGEVKLLIAGVEKASLKERLNGYHESIKKNQPEKGGTKIISIQRKLMVAASVALLATLSIWLFTTSKNKYEKTYAAYYKPDPGLMSAMGTSDNYLFNKAMLLYKTGKYKAAIEEWSKLKNELPQNDTLTYFLGAAQQADGNNVAAIMLLKSMTTDPAKLFYKDACWYTGLALIEQGAVNEAIPYLEKSERPESSELISKIK